MANHAILAPTVYVDRTVREHRHFRRPVVLPLLTPDRLHGLNDQVVQCASSRELDDLTRRVWRDYGRNSANAGSLAQLKEMIQVRREAMRCA